MPPYAPGAGGVSAGGSSRVASSSSAGTRTRSSRPYSSAQTSRSTGPPTPSRTTQRTASYRSRPKKTESAPPDSTAIARTVSPRVRSTGTAPPFTKRSRNQAWCNTASSAATTTSGRRNSRADSPVVVTVRPDQSPRRYSPDVPSCGRPATNRSDW